MALESQPELKALCVFCGSAMGSSPRFREAAERLGRNLARSGITLVYGGGHIGLMGALAGSALAEGGRVVGIIPEHLLKVESPFREISELVVVDSMHSRKRRMFDLADAFCVLPGGLGTLDETFEILTWRQLALHDKPVILANIEKYWTPWMELVEGMIANGFAQPKAQSLFTMVDDVDDILPTVRRQIVGFPPSEPDLF
jgi:hypothetical protein